MSEEPEAKRRPRWLEYGALAAAVVLAIGVGLTLFLSGGGGGGGDTPEEAVRALYSDIANGDETDVNAALVPDARADDAFLIVPLGRKATVLTAKPAISGLKTTLIGSQGDWASVGVNGTVRDVDGEREGSGSVYL